MKTIKKIISLLLISTFLLAMVPFSIVSFADDYFYYPRIEFNGKIYYLVDDATTWDDANERTFGYGSLAVITSQEEYLAIQELVNSGSLSNYWIGAQRVVTSWQWTTGESFNYNRWPNGVAPSSGRYAYMSKDSSTWSSGSATATAGFIVEFENMYIPWNADIHNGNYYAVYGESLTWPQAEAVCESMGGHLVTIADKAENDFVAELISDCGDLKGTFWMGLSCPSAKNDFKWVTGEPFNYGNDLSSFPWSSGEPDSNSASIYVQMLAVNYSTTKLIGTWNDNPLNYNDTNAFWKNSNCGFVCEIENYLEEEPVSSGYFDDCYYEIYDRKSTFFDALLLAEGKEALLPCLESEEQNSELSSLFASTGLTGNYWISNYSVFTANEYDPDEYFHTWDTLPPISWNGFCFTSSSSQGVWNLSENRGPANNGAYIILFYDSKEVPVTFMDTSGKTIAAAVGYLNETIDSIESPKFCAPYTNELLEEISSIYDVDFYLDKKCTQKWDVENDVISGPLSLYIKFSHNIKLYDQDGSTLFNKEVIYNELFGGMPVPEKPGYMFNGWFTQRFGGSKITKYKKADLNVPGVLYAQWSAKQYLITFETLGGILNGSNSSLVTYNSQYGALPTAVKSGYSFGGWTLSDSSKSITGNSTVTTAADHVLVAKWNNRTATSLSAFSMPEKTDYIYGEALNTDGLALEITYDNGETEVIGSGFGCFPTVLTSVGTNSVTVSYAGLQTSFNVNVSRGEPTSVVVRSLPSKTNYIIDDSLDATGFELTVSYADGTSESVTDGIDFYPSVFTKAGKYRVKATYGNFETYFYVDVNAPQLKTISVIQTPSKTDYFVNDELELSGLKVKALFYDGTSEEITDYTVTCPTDTAGTQMARISYSYCGQSFVTSFNITVHERAPQTDNILSSDNVNTQTGEQITIPVRITNNTGLTGFEIFVDYDSGLMTPAFASPGEVIESYMVENGVMPDGRWKIVGFDTSGSETSADGELINLTFDISADASSSSSVNITGSRFNSSYATSDFRPCSVSVAIAKSAKPSVSIVMAEGTVGNDVYVPLRINNPGNARQMNVSIVYDSEALEFISGGTYTRLDDETVNITVVLPEDKTEQTEYLRFRISSTASNLTEIEITDAVFDGNPVKHTNGFVRIDKSAQSENLSIAAGDLVINPGERIYVPICVTGNVGINSMMIDIEFDSSILTPVSVTKGSALSRFNKEMMNDNIGLNQDSFKFIWMASENFVGDGEFFILAFDTNSNFKGNTYISVSCDDIYDAGGNLLSVKTAGAKVSSKEKAAYSITWIIDSDNTQVTSVFEGDPIVSPTVHKSNYTFMGWNNTVPKIMPQQNLTFTAVFTPVEYTATFVVNGETVSTQKYNVLTESLMVPEIPCIPYKLNERWESYNLSKGGNIEIHAIYESPATIVAAQHTVYINNKYKLLTSSNYSVTQKEYVSDDKSVAVVDSSGNIIAVGKGECIIKVYCRGKDEMGNDISSSAYTKLIVLNADEDNSGKSSFRESFDFFFRHTLYDIVESLKRIFRYLARFVPAN